MKLLGLELSDAGIMVATSDSSELINVDGEDTESPGIAVTEQKRLLVGRTAEHRARLYPHQVNSIFWDQLSLAPLKNTVGQARSHAEIAWMHLGKIWENIRQYGDQLIIAVPEMFDHDQFLVSSVMFTKISIGSDVTDSGPLLESSGDGVVKQEKTISTKSPSVIVGSESWNFNSVPAGFIIRHHRANIPHHKQRNIEHYIFSDGIASFSVYIEQTEKVRLKGPAHLGALNAFGAFIDGHQVTAVGEVPADTLTFITKLEKK